MKTLALWIFILGFATSALALDEFPLSPWLTYGIESRWEKTSTQDIVGRNLNPFAVGASWGHFILYYEYGSFTDLTGNTALSVNRKFVNHLLAVNYRNDDWGFSEYFIPYLGMGLGTQKETLDTTLLAQTTTDTSRDYLLSEFHTGVQWNYTKLLWFSLEARLLFGEKTEPNPQVSVLGRLGFWIR